MALTATEFIDVALWFPEVVETEPFVPGIPVYKVAGKMFALLDGSGTDAPARVTLKCDPERALVLRTTYSAVRPGYHMNKRHWNTIDLDGTVPDDELLDLVHHSYVRTVSGLRSADRDRILALLGDDRPPLPDTREP
ncbi:MmcQ/YjbR family DNA-binding protein [Lipingzhangella sp. LS1_29]|uniref:MmcQ/YjbR family DNA-binding protein n=1 Tax=Lipingzhangella rawalii TaxID=2055835 RepID=A0ABU2H4T7_9ACTN|nr:MmcQ/YjbR family DNA-binding protein [Lipingzhangella rawalii]MDS1270322.1 MmcQ/YjbR family DNA-binding protein [Lipingzhangella rawalii]